MAPRFEDLQAEYADLWQRMMVLSNRASAVKKIASRLLGFKSRYQSVAEQVGVPWFVIAAIHNRESDANFTTYLGNGEPLNRITHLVPRGRGPFATWEAGAIDALRYDGLDKVALWSAERACYEIEKYNGWGYRTKRVNSPYLWSFSNNYQSGKYVADGRFDPNAVDQQCGAIPIIKEIMAQDASATFIVAPAPLQVSSSLAMGSQGDRVVTLQKSLEERGYSVGTVDGIYGSKTRDAVTAFQQAANLPVNGIADDKTLQALMAKAPIGPVVNGGVVPSPVLQPGDVVRILLEELGKVAGGVAGTRGTPTGGGQTVTSILQQILLAGFRPSVLATSSPTTAGASTTPAANGTSPVVLTPIDQILGGQALAGKKTALAIVAYAIVSVLQAAGVITAGSPAGIILNTIIAAFGALGGLSKIDRIIQTLGTVANKPSG